MWRLLVLAVAAVWVCLGAWLVLADCSPGRDDMPDVEGPVRAAEYHQPETSGQQSGRSGDDHRQHRAEAEMAPSAAAGPALLPDVPHQARPLKPGGSGSAHVLPADESSRDDYSAGRSSENESSADGPPKGEPSGEDLSDDESSPEDPAAEPQSMPGDARSEPIEPIEPAEPNSQKPHLQPPPVDGPVLPGLQPPESKPSVVPAPGGKADATRVPSGINSPLPPLEPSPSDGTDRPSGLSKPVPNQAGPSPSADLTPPMVPAPIRRPLTPAQAALRDRLRRVVGYYQAQPLNPQQHTATELLYAAMAFGVNTEVHPPGSKKLNGITYLCWNLPCAGGELLTVVDGRIAARVGYMFQRQDGQMLAVLALARVPRNYPMRAGGVVGTVADLVEYEKLSCRAGSELSLKLIGLSYYVDEPDWQNELGQNWSLERMVGELLVQPTAALPEGGTTRLLALACALGERRRRNQPIDGQFAAAQQLVERFRAIALDVQNADGSWGPAYFAGRSTSREPAVQLRCTAQMLGWLVRWAPAEQLDDPRLVRSVQYLLELLGGHGQAWNLRGLSTRDFAAVMHALDALSAYDERFFKPAEVAELGPSPRMPQTTNAGAVPQTRQPQRTAEQLHRTPEQTHRSVEQPARTATGLKGPPGKHQ